MCRLMGIPNSDMGEAYFENNKSNFDHIKELWLLTGYSINLSAATADDIILALDTS